MNVVRLMVTILIIAAVNQTGITVAQDWPQWRGPNRDGHVAGFKPPAAWPDKLNRRWKVTVGEGHSSPIVVGGRIYVHARKQDLEVVSCTELNTGKLLWEQPYPVAYTMHPAAMGHGKGPKSTPVFFGGRLYTLGITGVISCLDGANGRVIWRKDFSQRFKRTSPLFGTAMSPIISTGMLIAHVGGHDQGALIALDAATGDTEWEWTGDGPGYASPVILGQGSTSQLITQTQQNIVGIAVADGRLLWQMPFTTEYVQNIITPLVYQDTVILSGLDKGTFAIRPVRKDGGWTTTTLWQNNEIAMYMSSPILHGNSLYGMSHKRKGQFFCVDVKTGKTLWRTEGREAENAALLSAGPVLLILKEDAELIIAKSDAGSLQPLKKYTVADSPTWAHPVVVNRGLLIKDAQSLTLWSFT